jgi:type I restriction enzyme S subunit
MRDSCALSDYLDLNPATDVSHRCPDECVSFLPMASVEEGGGWSNDETRPLSSAKTGYTLFRDGDVICAKITPCFENGKVALLRGLVGGVGLGSTEFHVLRPRNDTDARFIYQWVQHPEFRRAGEAAMTGSAGQRRVPSTFFHRFRVPITAPAEQRAIADVLDAVDAAIRETEALIAKLKRLRLGLIDDLLTRGIDDNGELRSSNTLAGSAIGPLPSHWIVGRLDTSFGVFGGKRLPMGHNYALEATGFRYLRVTDFFGEVSRVEQLPSLEARTFKALQRYEINDGSLVVSIAGSIGRFHPFRNDTDLRVILTENAARLQPKKSINLDFYARYLNSPPVRKQVEIEIGTGGGVPKLALHRIQSLKIAEVPRDEQDEISRRLDALDTKIEAYRIERAKLSSLREGLRDDLLTGRVRVAVAGEAHA